MVRKFITLAVLSTVIALGIMRYSHSAATQSQGDVPEDQIGTLNGFALAAQEQGDTEVNLGEGIIFDGTLGLDPAVSNYTVIAATPISKNSYVLDPYSIGTWYKFQVNETLAQKPLSQCAGCPPIPDAPADMLPLNPGEILVLQPGGSQVVNGITINIGVSDFPEFTLNQKYLLFINLDAARNVGSVELGPTGVYMIDASGNLSPVFQADPGENPIADDLAARYGSNLSQLRAALNPAPPPPSCDPNSEQSCYDMGGDWDDSSCTCYRDPCTRKPYLCE